MKRTKLAGLLCALVFLCTASLSAQEPSIRDAMRLSREGKTTEAVALLKEMIRQKSRRRGEGSPFAPRFRLFQGKKHDEALAEFDRTIAIDKDTPLAYYFKGLIYEAKAKNDKANEDLYESKALEAWNNVLETSERVKDRPRKPRKGITVEKAVEQAKEHVAKLKEELRDEKK
jgi:hypothetical protein